jgi:hypothetical protein
MMTPDRMIPTSDEDTLTLLFAEPDPDEVNPFF